MVSKIAIAFTLVSLTAGPVFAEGEGRGEPFPAQSAGQAYRGAALASDTGSAAYPALTGVAIGISSLATLEPALSNEAVIQTVNSQPRSFTADPAAYARAHTLPRHAAAEARVAG
jgi:hypothetical protein